MFGMLSTILAELAELEFLRGVDFVAVGDIVLTFADSADKREEQPLVFFRHVFKISKF